MERAKALAIAVAAMDARGVRLRAPAEELASPHQTGDGPGAPQPGAPGCGQRAQADRSVERMERCHVKASDRANVAVLHAVRATLTRVLAMLG